MEDLTVLAAEQQAAKTQRHKDESRGNAVTENFKEGRESFSDRDM